MLSLTLSLFSVQTARAAEKEVANIQMKKENATESATAYQKKLLEQLEKLQDERNAIIVFLVKGSKQIADKEAEVSKSKIQIYNQ